MKTKNILIASSVFISLVLVGACKIPAITTKAVSKNMPGTYTSSSDTTNDGVISWRNYYQDQFLTSLIDSALVRNQELAITLQEVEARKNEIRARQGEYLPFVNLAGAGGIDKTGRYTWDGLAEEDLKNNPSTAPKHIGDFMLGAYASWELDVWKKLRTQKKSATLNYLSSIEGKNFLVTNLVGEIASSYYELQALDNLLAIIQQSIEIQQSAITVIQLEKEAAKVTQLAVNRFEAQLLHTQNLKFQVQQQITETENRINFLVGRYPQPVRRSATSFNTDLRTAQLGLPSQLLLNRPDIRQAEFDLAAAELDIKVARANFYPSVRLTAGLGVTAFNPGYIIKPESVLYNMAGDLISPLVNKNAIKATYQNASLKQVMAAYNYERSILNGYVEVINQLNALENFGKSYATKKNEVDILMQSIDISNSLFRSARADYLEVLLTQREALESKMELVETRLKQLAAKVSVYRSLGGGWR
jgi:multidrug efflux system outer membrane protein